MSETEETPIQVDPELEELFRSRRFYWSWSKGERAYARLHRECMSFSIDLRHLRESSTRADKTWSFAAHEQLLAATAFLKKRDVEGGWLCLHAAQRYAVYGLSDTQLLDRAAILRIELTKMSVWRAKAIDELLRDGASVTPERLIESLRLRDENDANQYHKIWLTADQLGLLAWTCAIGLLFLLPLAFYFHFNTEPGSLKTLPPWGFAMLSAVLVLGLLGSAFSIVQSIITDTSGAKIPERVANHWVTFIRALFGSVAGLAGYAFLKSRIINIRMGDDGDPVAFALAVAFLFGYTGERLIMKVAATVSSSKKS